MSRHDLFDTRRPDPTNEIGTVDAVAVAEQIPGRRFVRKGFDDLLSSPSCRRRLADIDMQDMSALKTHDNEDIEQTEGKGGHDEEVEGSDLAGVVLQECPPGLRRGPASTGFVFSDRGLADRDAELG